MRDPEKDSTLNFSIEEDVWRAELLAAVYDRATFHQLVAILDRSWKRRLTVAEADAIMEVNPARPLGHDDLVHGHAILDKARQFVGEAGREMPRTGTILENGCGLGHFLDGFASEFEAVITIDFSLAYLVISKKLVEERGITNVTFVCANVERLPIADGSIDFIHSNNVIEHVANKERMIREGHRVLRRGGLMFLLSPNHFTAYFEPHFGLPFYGFIPRPLRQIHARRRGTSIESVTLVSLRQLRQLCQSTFGAVPISFVPRHLRSTVMGGMIRNLIVKALNSPLGGIADLVVNRLLLPIMPYHVALCFKDR